jgi:hypothetical protein
MIMVIRKFAVDRLIKLPAHSLSHCHQLYCEWCNSLLSWQKACFFLHTWIVSIFMTMVQEMEGFFFLSDWMLLSQPWVWAQLLDMTLTECAKHLLRIWRPLLGDQINEFPYENIAVSQWYRLPDQLCISCFAIRIAIMAVNILRFHTIHHRNANLKTMKTQFQKLNIF